MKSIGIDLSLLSTGICVLSGNPGEEPKIRTVLLKKDKTKTELGRIQRLLSIASDIVSIVKEESPDVVVIEAPAKNQKWQMAYIGEAHGVVKSQMYSLFGIVPMVEQATKLRSRVVGKIEFEVVKTVDDSGVIKKTRSYGTIKGKSGKQIKATVKDVIEARLSERGLSFASQDEMDAYVAASYGWQQISQGGS